MTTDVQTDDRQYAPPVFDWSYFLHNLRNNLGAVTGFFECIEMMPKTAAAMTPKMVGQFRHASEKALKDIEEASYLLHPLALEATEIQLEPWLRERVETHPVNSNPMITVAWEIREGFPKTLRADRDLLARAIKEILDNCVDALSKGGQVTVTLSGSRAGLALIEIRNTGDPISQDFLEAVTQPFYTNKQARRGLGLAWARKIAVEHGGSLSVSNADKGGVSVILQVG